MQLKNYTDLEQSKILAEYLPSESADAHYWRRSWQLNDYVVYPSHSEELQKHFEAKKMEYIPCWSLSALKDILPVGTESHKQSDGSISYYYVEVYNNKKYFSTKRYDNLVDACVEMVLKLHELNLL